jgi:hypothetical protein
MLSRQEMALPILPGTDPWFNRRETEDETAIPAISFRRNRDRGLATGQWSVQCPQMRLPSPVAFFGLSRKTLVFRRRAARWVTGMEKPLEAHDGERSPVLHKSGTVFAVNTGQASENNLVPKTWLMPSNPIRSGITGRCPSWHDFAGLLEGRLRGRSESPENATQGLVKAREKK